MTHKARLVVGLDEEERKYLGEILNHLRLELEQPRLTQSEAVRIVVRRMHRVIAGNRKGKE